MSVHDHYAAMLDRAMHREAVRQCDPGAIRDDLAAAGVRMPFVEGAYRIGTRRVLDQADVAQWYAVQTAPRMEQRAAAELRDLGHCCRVPMRGYLRQTRRKGKDGRFVKEAAYVPLCTGYAFLGLPGGVPDWRTIRGRDGVVGVLGLDGVPEPIRAVAKLYALFAADEAGVFDKAQWDAEPGRAVQFAETAFAGFIGRVIAAKGDAVRVVLDELFGGVEVAARKDQLEPV